MYSTEIYQYIPRQLVVVDIGSSPRRYDNVYAKTLKLHKGSDSRLQFQFLNQEQKPVNITNKIITFRLIGSDNNTILLQKSLINTLPLTGIAELRVTSANLDNIVAQRCYYSLELPDDVGLQVPGFIDKNGTGRGDIDIVNSVYPAITVAQELSILSGVGENNTAPDTYYSEIYKTNYRDKVTLQLMYDGFVGTITTQGSTDGQSGWYDIEYEDYISAFSTTEGYTINGFHPYMRIKFVSTVGSVTKILVR